MAKVMYFKYLCPCGEEKEVHPKGRDPPNVVRCPNCDGEMNLKKVLFEEIKSSEVKTITDVTTKRPKVKETDLDHFKGKCTPEIYELLVDSHKYCLSLGLTAVFRKHYISYRKGRTNVLRLGLSKTSMSIPFNSDKEIKDDRIVNTSDAVGDNFDYFIRGLKVDDFELIKKIIDLAKKRVDKLGRTQTNW